MLAVAAFGRDDLTTPQGECDAFTMAINADRRHAERDDDGLQQDRFARAGNGAERRRHEGARHVLTIELTGSSADGTRDSTVGRAGIDSDGRVNARSALQPERQESMECGRAQSRPEGTELLVP